MRYILSIIGMIGSFYLIKFREPLGDMIGETEVMRKLGGVYTVIVIIACVIFFWSLAELTNTTHLLFAPLRFLFPGGLRGAGGDLAV
ncbi:MAG: hypothetical protein G01um101425_764 [Candidatus Peregrinibacteria bacterium Gr01-1014_25]|nr:MAG: hypothetical protein G01um101425_764 [Candidatus Peregrinibacteria bacterium Gr01-1014_25]